MKNDVYFVTCVRWAWHYSLGRQYPDL